MKFGSYRVARSIAIFMGMSSLICLSAAAFAQQTHTTTFMAHSAVSGMFTLTGNRQGQAILTNTQTGATTAFSMDAGKWVRDVFFLDGGNTIAASQTGQTFFWDAVTGQQKASLPVRIQGFSNNQKVCFSMDDLRRIVTYTYPGLTQTAAFVIPYSGGIDSFLFSPNDATLAIGFHSSQPGLEINYPLGNPTMHGLRSTYLFDVAASKEIPLPDFDHNAGLGAFSADSKYYYYTSGGKTFYNAANNIQFMDLQWAVDLTSKQVLPYNQDQVPPITDAATGSHF